MAPSDPLWSHAQGWAGFQERGSATKPKPFMSVAESQPARTPSLLHPPSKHPFFLILSLSSSVFKGSSSPSTTGPGGSAGLGRFIPPLIGKKTEQDLAGFRINP